MSAARTTYEATNTSPTAVALTSRLFYRYLDAGDRMATRTEGLGEPRASR